MSKSSLHRTYRSIDSILVIGCLGFLPGCAQGGDTDTRADGEVTASTNGARAVTWETFLKHVVHDPSTDTYIVEGDMRFSGEAAVRRFYERNFPATNALISHKDPMTDVDTLWTRTERWNITYCIQSGQNGFSAALYPRVQQAMRRAAAAWENIADVRFPYLSGEDANCSTNTNVKLQVVPMDWMGQASNTDASSIFPYDVDRRVMINTVKTYTDQFLMDVVTHELGHTLGFWHEHVRNPEAFVQPNNCTDGGTFAGPAVEPWVGELTAYDGYSVMHYHQCPGAMMTRYMISQRDIEGVQRVYEAPTNVIASNGVLYARKRENGHFYRWNGSGWEWCDTPSQAYIPGSVARYALQNGAVWKFYLTSWTNLGSAGSGPGAQLFPCPATSVCQTDHDYGDVYYWEPVQNYWRYFGGPGAKFASNYGNVLGLGPAHDYIAWNQPAVTEGWSVLPGGGALTLIGPPSGVYQHNLYRVTLDGEKIQRFAQRANNPWLDVFNGRVSQFFTTGLYSYSIDIVGTGLYQHDETTKTRTAIDGDSVRIYGDDQSPSVVYATDVNENIWRLNGSGWTYFSRP